MWFGVGGGGSSRLFLSPGLTGWLLFSLGLSWMVSWPEGLVDAYITMIPKADGDATLLGSFPCASCRLFIAFGRLSGCGIWMIGFGLGSLLLCLALGWSRVCGGLVFHCFEL